MEISPDFIVRHATLAAWVLGVCGSAALIGLGWTCKKVILIYNQAQRSFTNCIPTIQNSNEAISVAVLGVKEQQIQTNAKLDVLIQVIERKL